MITRREPLLWLQLMAVAVIPLELELLRLLLAGPALGPAPALERLLIWGLAVIGPGLLLWRRPADWGSMLLVRLPLAGRSSDQRRISALPQTLAMKVALVLGMGLLLFSFWSIDRSALLVTQMSPLVDGSRLTALLLAGPLLTLMLWQWQQLSQAIWLLTRSDQAFENLQPMSEAELRDRTMSFGLNVLQLSALEWPTPQTPATAPTPTSIDSEEPTADASEAAAPELADTAKEPEAVDPETSASVSAEKDEPALDASDDSASVSNAKQKSEPKSLKQRRRTRTIVPDGQATIRSVSAEKDEPALDAIDDSSTSSEAAAEPDNAKQEQSEPEEPETEETDTDDAELDPAVPEILDSAEDADAEDEPHETSASVSAEKDEPALDASDDSSTSSEAAAEPDNAKQDESEPKGPETEEPETDVPETDAEATSEPTTTTDDAESVKSAVSGSIKPEEGTTDDDGSDLDGEVTDNDLIPGGEAERHHEET